MSSEVSNKPKPAYHTCTEYRIKTLLPGDGWLAVWVEEDDLTRVASPVDFVGIARKTIELYKRRATGGLGDLVRTDHEDELIGIEVTVSGSWHIVNDNCNFCGLVRKGNRIDVVNNSLNRKSYPAAYADTLRAQKEQAEEFEREHPSG